MNPEQFGRSAIDVSKLKRRLCYESQQQSQSNEKSLVQFHYEKVVSNYLGTQSTFKKESIYMNGPSGTRGQGSTWGYPEAFRYIQESSP